MPNTSLKMVPTQRTFAYIADDTVQALVTWYKDQPAEHPTLEASIYTVLPDPPDELNDPCEMRIGERIADLCRRGRLIPYGAQLAELHDLYRVDDNRPGRQLSYMIWYGQPDKQGPSLIPGTIYGHFKDGHRDPEQEGPFPAEMRRETLEALMAAHGVSPITRVADLATNLSPGETIPDDLGGPIRVWDIGAMYRT